MYDDRLLIRSPGKFPKMVDENNIRETRYSRNPRIARALTEIGWVRELGEGVKRIYQEMAGAYLPPPVYEETGQTVLLTLLNKIDLRRKKRATRLSAKITAAWPTLAAEEKTALQLVYASGFTTSKALSVALAKSVPVARKVLNQLVASNFLVMSASAKTDPNRRYLLVDE